MKIINLNNFQGWLCDISDFKMVNQSSDHLQRLMDAFLFSSYVCISVHEVLCFFFFLLVSQQEVLYLFDSTKLNRNLVALHIDSSSYTHMA